MKLRKFNKLKFAQALYTFRVQNQLGLNEATALMKKETGGMGSQGGWRELEGGHLIKSPGIDTILAYCAFIHKPITDFI